MLRDKSLNDLDDFLLLSTWELRDGVEDLPNLAAGRGGAPRLRLAEQFLDRDAKRLRHRQQDIGLRSAPAPFPITHVRRMLANLGSQGVSP